MSTVISSKVVGGNNIEVDDDFTGTGVLPDQIQCTVTNGGPPIAPTQTQLLGSVKQYFYNNLPPGSYFIAVQDPTNKFNKDVTI
jgi:hypothetical protein